MLICGARPRLGGATRTSAKNWCLYFCRSERFPLERLSFKLYPTLSLCFSSSSHHANRPILFNTLKCYPHVFDVQSSINPETHYTTPIRNCVGKGKFQRNTLPRVRGKVCLLEVTGPLGSELSPLSGNVSRSAVDGCLRHRRGLQWT